MIYFIHVILRLIKGKPDRPEAAKEKKARKGRGRQPRGRPR